MGTVVDELRVNFIGDDRSLGKTAGGLTGIMGKLGAGVAAGAAVAGAAVVGLGAGMLKLAADAEPVVGIRDSFNALTRDMQRGSAGTLAALQDASAGLVSNTDLMTSFNKAAQLVSKDFAESLPGVMDEVGKVAAATGQDVGFLMDSLVTGIGRLSPMILDNLGIQVDATKAYEDFAAANGLVASEMTKTEQQMALMEQVQTKLEENTADMAAPSGGFAQLKVAMTNLKDTIGTALVPAISPLLERLAELANQWLPVVAEWLEVNIPIAAKAMADFWTNELQPVVEVFWAFLKDSLIPFIRDTLIPIFRDRVTSSVTRVIDVWNVLQPIIETVYTFIRDNLMPIWIAIMEVWREIADVVLTALAGIWQNVLLPVLTEVWEFIKERLTPVWESFTGLVDGLTGSFGGLSGIVQTVVGWLSSVKDAIANIELPDWLTPGSPTPFEIGLKGIGLELENLARNSIPAFGAGMEGLQTTNNNQRTVTQNFNISTTGFNLPMEQRAALQHANGGI